MKLIKICCLSGALIASGATRAGEAEITAAYDASDVQQLKALGAELDQTSYWSAYLDWRLGSLLFGGETVDEADAVLLRGQEKLVSLTSANPESAEGWALLSVTIGMRIGVRPGARAMKMGPASSRAGKRAVKLEPDNPRVLLLVGINKFNTPAFFGGGKKKARKYLDRALARWQRNGPGQYQWGLADIHIWRGRANEALRDQAAACMDYAAALKVSPGSAWAASLHARLECNAVS